MLKEKKNREDKPTPKNILDVVIEIPKADVITPTTVLKTLYRINIDAIIHCIILSIFLFTPILCCIFFYDDTFRWYYAILPILGFIGGVSSIYSTIAFFIESKKREKQILSGNFIVKKSAIIDVYSEYDSSAEGYGCDYYIKIYTNTKNWIKVSKPVYDAVRMSSKTCYGLYLSENGENVLLMVYIGECIFDKNVV